MVRRLRQCWLQQIGTSLLAAAIVLVTARSTVTLVVVSGLAPCGRTVRHHGGRGGENAAALFASSGIDRHYLWRNGSRCPEPNCRSRKRLPKATLYLKSSPLDNLTEPAAANARTTFTSNDVESNSPMSRTDSDNGGTTTTTSSITSPTNDLLLGYAVLATVPLAWGTYTPVVQYVQALAVPGFVFSAAYYCVAAITLWSVLYIQQLQQKQEQQPSQQQNAKQEENNPSQSAQYETSNGMDCDRNEGDSETPIAASSVVATALAGQPLQRLELPIQGGMELGLYLFLGNVLQIAGLQLGVPAQRAGFLVQLTTILVPILQSIAVRPSKALPVGTWVACALALGGIVIMDLDKKSFSDIVNLASVGVPNLNGGDACILGASVIYSWHVIRLETYARRHTSTPLLLAACKATAEALLSVALVVGLLGTVVWSESVDMRNGATNGMLQYVQQTGQEIEVFWAMFSADFMTTTSATGAAGFTADQLFVALGAILWTGWITCAYTIYAQAFGQARVPPTQANLMYSSQPLCTALFAYLLLGQVLEPTGVVGGAMILAAVYMVASSPADPDEKSMDEKSPQ